MLNDRVRCPAQYSMDALVGVQADVQERMHVMSRDSGISMRFPNFMRWTILAAGCVLAIGFAAMLVRAQLSANWKEFTLMRRESSQSVDGSSGQRISFEARRQDGSIATGAGSITTGAPEMPSLGGGTRSVFINPLGQKVVVDDTVRMKSTYLRQTKPDHPLQDSICGAAAISPAVRPVVNSGEQVMGYRTVAIETHERVGGKEEYVHTEWRAPDLDCAVIKVSENRVSEDGKVSGHFDMMTFEITMGPPDPKLFNIPDDYGEVSPSAMQEARRKALGLPPVPPRVLESLRKRDSLYFQNR